MSSTTRALTLCWLLAPGLALAHHPPRQTAPTSGGFGRSLAGQAARATDQAMLVAELMRSSDEPTGGVTTTTTTTAALALAPHPWWSVGAYFPWVVVDQADDGWVTGYGDTTLEVILTPSDQRAENNVWSLGLRSSLPTRSYALAFDPGKTYTLSPFVSFTRRYEHFYWLASLETLLETRPAGLAWEGQASALLGYMTDEALTMAIGARTDTRITTYCRLVSGALEYCDSGRATERQRQTGATRVYLLSSLSYRVGAFDLIAGVQMPLTSKRDFAYAVSTGAMFQF